MTLEISAQDVKELRGKTGAGMMDCKKALQDSAGNFEKAIETLRQKGLAAAGKKAGRVTAEGLIESYIHAGSKIGVLVEINCETDFVARRTEFQQLAKNVAMQIAASPNVEYVSIDCIPKHVQAKEKHIESSKDDIQGKPEEVKDKIVTGRLRKRFSELSLVDQNFIKDPSITVQDLINKNISILGENIQIRRFSRFLLGEGVDNHTTDFAEEVTSMLKS
uniref:Multifunctional fusion protein n=1 Tax=Yamadaella caenomyce TaxID=259029 RepID=A0A1G4NZ48_9FLOR|nr:Translation elongation factor Ts [Yamadaella caenomyce]SCW23796.1 Translation elongation factor Ts [Yamadaella caenomyce]